MSDWANQQVGIEKHPDQDWSTLSEQLLRQVKMKEDTEVLRKQLAQISVEGISPQLSSDAVKKSFWINIYNAWFLILRRDRHIEKPAIYREKLIPIAGHLFSLDDIEHGILRKYRWKWSLGFLPDPFASRLIRSLAVSRLDYRIHFALNCGAKSCPPIAFYRADRLDQQLETATLSFLEQETEVRPDQQEVHLTRLFQWYAGDFGGHQGIRRILKEKFGLNTQGMKLIYKTYDWEEQLDNFRDNE